MKARDVVEEAVALLRCNREKIVEMLPFQLTIHFPPADGNDKVVMEIARAKLKENPQ